MRYNLLDAIGVATKLFFLIKIPQDMALKQKLVNTVRHLI